MFRKSKDRSANEHYDLGEVYLDEAGQQVTAGNFGMVCAYAAMATAHFTAAQAIATKYALTATDGCNASGGSAGSARW